MKANDTQPQFVETPASERLNPDRRMYGYVELFVADPVGDSSPRVLGSVRRQVVRPGRKLGHEGRERFKLVAPTAFDQGHKRGVVVNASRKNPVEGWSHVQALEGPTV